MKIEFTCNIPKYKSKKAFFDDLNLFGINFGFIEHTFYDLSSLPDQTEHGTSKFRLLAPVTKNNINNNTPDKVPYQKPQNDFNIYAIPTIARYIKSNQDEFIINNQYYYFTGNNDIYHVMFPHPPIIIKSQLNFGIRYSHSHHKNDEKIQYKKIEGYIYLQKAMQSYSTNSSVHLGVKPTPIYYPIIEQILSNK